MAMPHRRLNPANQDKSTLLGVKMQDNSFWQYSLALYSHNAVESLLLTLQDDYGADVNLLLCCCWLGGLQHELTVEQCSMLVKTTARWRVECVIPLRSVRRFLKAQSEFDDFREQVKILEIEAERKQQILLYQQLDLLGLTRANNGGEDCSAQNLDTYCRVLPGVERSEVAETVTQLLSVIEAIKC